MLAVLALPFINHLCAVAREARAALGSGRAGQHTDLRGGAELVVRSATPYPPAGSRCDEQDRDSGQPDARPPSRAPGRRTAPARIRRGYRWFGLPGPLIDRAYESITAPRDRLDVPRRLRGVGQRLPQASDRRIQAAVEIHDGAVRP